MSPRYPTGAGKQRRFPRVSGDEPTIYAVTPYTVTFSPRERG